MKLEGRHLYRLGVNYFMQSNVKDRVTGKKAGYAFFCDSVTESQKEQLREICPTVQFRGSHPEYAPEMRRVAIFVPVTPRKPATK